MALPKVFVEALKAIPTKDLDHLCAISKLEKEGRKMTSKMLIEVFEKGDDIALRHLYNGIAPVLMLGGMMPGIGLACNIIDAAFCFTIGAWLDFIIDAIAIAFFEVPGVSGLKGISKGMMELSKCVKIDAKSFWKILAKLKENNVLKQEKIHELFTILLPLSNKPTKILYVDIAAISKSISEENLFYWGGEVLEKVARECEACGVKRVISKAVSKSGEEILQQYTTNLKLLELTFKKIKL